MAIVIRNTSTRHQCYTEQSPERVECFVERRKWEEENPPTPPSLNLGIATPEGMVNGEKVRGRRRYQMIDNIMINGQYEDTKRKAEKRVKWRMLSLQ